MKPLTHIDELNRPAMVDVSDKSVSRREATARSIVRLPQAVRDTIEGDEIASRKGPVFATAIIAGVMAAKRTHELIPFCHPLGLEKCAIDIRLVDDTAVVECTCGVEHKTGVEMEALTGATVAALTIYDMVKALAHDVVIAETRLVAKSGGRSDYRHEAGA